MNFEDRVQESTTSTGTGNITLAGALTGFRTFDSAFGHAGALANYFFYAIVAVDGNGAPTGDWETGTGHLSSSSTLVRDTVSRSSNSNSAVSFASGTKYVFATADAAYLNELRPYNNIPSTSLLSYTAATSGATQSATDSPSRGLSLSKTDGVTGNVERIVFRGKSVPASTPWTVTAKIEMPPSMNIVAYFRAGLALYESSTGKLLMSGPSLNNSTSLYLTVLYFSDLSTFSSGLASDLIGSSPLTGPVPQLFRISFDGTTYTFQVSFDEGTTWSTLATAAAASYFTADKIGFAMETFGNVDVSKYTPKIVVKHYDELG